MKILVRCCVLFILSAAAASAQQASDAEVSTIRQRYLQAFNEGNADKVVALYADDARLISEAGTFRDKTGIRQWIQASLDQGSKLESIESLREKTSGTLGYSIGRSRRRVGQEMHYGEYLLVIEKRDGEWKIIEHFSKNAKAWD